VSRVVVVGAGVGGLAAAVRCLQAGHAVTVLEAAGSPGGKAGRLERDGYGFDTGPSLLTMPWVFEELLGDDLPELLRVEPVTRYRFADGSTVDLSADLPVALSALEAWSPGAGDDWARFLGVCAGMWRASTPVLTGFPPWPPRRPSPGDPSPDPRDLARVKPWHTLRTLARGLIRDERLRLVVERFATYAGADPRRAPAALAVAGYVEHAFGAWHVRGGIYELVRALERRVGELGGEVRYGTPAERLLPHRARRTSVRPPPSGGARTFGGAVGGVGLTDGSSVAADWVLWNGDALALRRLLSRGPVRSRPRSVSGYVTLLGVRGRTPGLAHHTIAFPRSYDAEFDDIFVHRRPVREPTVYVSASSLSDPSEAPDGAENWFVLVNGPAGLDAAAWEGYDERVLERLGAAGLPPGGPVEVRATRSPVDLERETGAVGGAIYGDAPHGRLGTLLRPGPRVRGRPNLVRVGGTAHPGGGLPLVALSGALAARIVGPA
jgi:phytoene desaturase